MCLPSLQLRASLLDYRIAMLYFGPLSLMFDFRCPYGSITAIISNCLDYYFGFCCSCDLLLLAASHELMENEEVGFFDTAFIVNRLPVGQTQELIAAIVFFFPRNWCVNIAVLRIFFIVIHTKFDLSVSKFMDIIHLSVCTFSIHEFWVDINSIPFSFKLP